MNENKFIKENGYEIFETEWKNYLIPISQSIDDLISRPFLLFPFNMDDTIEGNLSINIDYPVILQTHTTTVDYFKSYILTLFHIIDLRASLTNSEDKILNTFPLNFGGQDLEIGMIYDTQRKFI
jgi:hypothetical protein